MKHILVELLSQMTALSPEEESAIEASFPIRTFPKGTEILREGQIARDSYYVIRGCVREYELRDGEEKTTAFYTEGDSVANFKSLANGSPSSIYFVCAEDSEMTVLNLEMEQELYRQFPRFETFCRTGMESMMGEKHEQLASYISLTPEERYKKLQEDRPDLLNRVPQYQIASYLGIKPETLSRIRKRMAG